jgi:hypothetical protein
MADQWSEWRRFPDPRKLELLTAPFGPGCYELRDGVQLVLYGMGGHVTEGMASRLPEPLGCGHRDNQAKREFILDHLGRIEYSDAGLCNARRSQKMRARIKGQSRLQVSNVNCGHGRVVARATRHLQD